MLKVRFSPREEEELSFSIKGLLNETRSAEDVLDTLAKSNTFSGTNFSSLQNSHGASIDTVKDVVNMRLREATRDAVYSGKKVSQTHVDRLAHSLKEAEASRSYVGADMNLEDFENLLRNMQVKHHTRGRVVPAKEMPMLVQQLRDWKTGALEHWNTGTLEPWEAKRGGVSVAQPLTQQTLTAVCDSLLKSMRKDPLACDQAVSAGVLHHVRALAFGSSSSVTELPGRPPCRCPHPELQLQLALIIAEVAVQKSIEAASDDGDKLRRTAGIGVIGAMGEARQAMETLLAMLRRALLQREHATVWAAVLALSRLAQEPRSSEMLITSQCKSLLQDVLRFYSYRQEFKGNLPLAVPIKPVPFIASAPPKLLAPKVGALNRASVTVKERWLGKSESLPSLTGQSNHWLSGRSSLDLTMPLSHAASQPLVASAPRPHLSSSRSQLWLTMGSTGASDSALRLPPVKPSAPEHMPSLLWLVKEDGVDYDAYYRVCDRNYIVLQVKRLQKQCEGVQSELAAFKAEYDRRCTESIRLWGRPIV